MKVGIKNILTCTVESRYNELCTDQENSLLYRREFLCKDFFTKMLSYVFMDRPSITHVLDAR